MSPQLQLNTGAQDALLYDNTRSYFTNVGYVRTSNFQMELRDIESIIAPNLGGKAEFVVPKAADLLGPCDLLVEFNAPTTASVSSNSDPGAVTGWVDNLGYAMIEKLQFMVGHHEVEVLTGEHLNIINELMRDDKSRHNFSHTLRTGRPLARQVLTKHSGNRFEEVGTVTGSPASADTSPLVKTGHTAGPFQAGDQLYTAAGVYVTTLTAGFSAVGQATPGAHATATNNNLAFVSGTTVSGTDATYTVRRPFPTGAQSTLLDISDEADTYDRIISHGQSVKAGKKLCIPLGLFFTKHPSAYFPLAAIAGCNEVKIVVKFRQLNELLMGTSPVVPGSGGVSTSTGLVGAGKPFVEVDMPSWTGSVIDKCTLRCHYIHVTGPEATSLMNREHVRLMKMWDNNHLVMQKSLTHSATGTDGKFEIDLNFLHPVSELIITIRKVSEMGSSRVVGGTNGPKTSNRASPDDTYTNRMAREKNYFAYQGGKRNPNIEAGEYSYEQDGAAVAHTDSTYLETKDFKLTLNGQSRHLDGQGIDRDYLMNRLMPMLHSNTNDKHFDIHRSSSAGLSATGVQPFMERTDDLLAMHELFGRKEIYCYPFSLAPEAANPSGAVNFSKVSHAKLAINIKAFAPQLASGSVDDVYQLDVYGVNYNWLAIKDGRAMTSFA